MVPRSCHIAAQANQSTDVACGNRVRLHRAARDTFFSETKCNQAGLATVRARLRLSVAAFCTELFSFACSGEHSEKRSRRLATSRYDRHSIVLVGAGIR